MKKIIIITGTRADYGIYKPVAESLVADDWDLSFLVSGMHLAKKYGDTIKEIERDGFSIAGKINSLFLENSKGNMSRSLSLEVAGFTDVLENEKPDFVLLLGDRGEMLAAAICCLYLGIKTAHLHGGEVSGTVDESIRHAVSKLSAIHFTSTSFSAERLIKMGEDPWRVFNVGAPRIDTIVKGELPEFSEVIRKYELPIEPKKYLLLVFHPVVTEYEDVTRQIKEVISSLKQLDCPAVCILPNADAGGDLIRTEYEKADLRHVYYVNNLSSDDYLTILKEALFLMGNSSSGIIEAASFSVPVINIGTRQNGRDHSDNILDVEVENGAILDAYERINDAEFQEQLPKLVNIYGVGEASGKIVDILDQIYREEDQEKWLQKKITY